MGLSYKGNALALNRILLNANAKAKVSTFYHAITSDSAVKEPNNTDLYVAWPNVRHIFFFFKLFYSRSCLLNNNIKLFMKVKMKEKECEMHKTSRSWSLCVLKCKMQLNKTKKDRYSKKSRTQTKKNVNAIVKKLLRVVVRFCLNLFYIMNMPNTLRNKLYV